VVDVFRWLDALEERARYTARASLLFVGGSSVPSAAKLTFTSAGGCDYPPVTAARSVAITAVRPSRNPLTHGYWTTAMRSAYWTRST
jgi:hypothetical protein